jgi:hypothetical protein
MTRILLLTVVIGVLIGFDLSWGKPMDAEDAKLLPKLQQIVNEVRRNGLIRSQDAVYLKRCIETKNPVLTALSLWCARVSTSNIASLEDLLKDVKPQLQQMPLAFVTLYEELVPLREKGVDVTARKLLALSQSSNPYLRLESARELVKIDSALGRARLEELTNDSSSFVATYAAAIARKLGYSKAALVPLPYEEYSTVLTVLEPGL